VSPRHAVLAILGLLLVAGSALPEERVSITFKEVKVKGFMGLFDSPAVAHRDPPDDGQVGSPERGVRPGNPAPSLPGTLPRTHDVPLAAVRARPTQPMAFAPGQGTANPSFTQHGFLVEVFWAVRIGTPEAFFRRAHFHPPDLASGFEGQHFGNPTELHGLYIRSLDGKPFGVKSLRYRVTYNRELLHKPFSIEGFSNYNVNVLVSRTFDPRLSVRTQFVTFPVGLPAGNDVTLPWWTLPVTGFELVDHVYIASSASVDFDDIVLTRFGGATNPGKEGDQ